MTSGRSSARVLFAAIVLAGLNLRTVFASLPPLLVHVRHDLGLSAGAAGLLTTGPVLCFGIFAPLAPRVACRFPIERLLLAAALVTTLGTTLRALGGVAPLFAGTLLAGVAVALAQTLVPILVRARFPAHAGPLMGAFSMALPLGAAVAAGSAVPLEHLLHGWRGSLAAFALPSALAVVAWLIPAGDAGTTMERHTDLGLHRSRGSWSVAAYFGLQAMAFYSGLTWLPTILVSHGYSEASAGGLQALSSVLQFGPAFLIPVFAGRRCNQTSILVLLAGVAVIALAGILVAPGASLLWMSVLGLAQGGALGLALILPVLRARTGPGVAALTAMTLCFGYSIAAAGPWILGLAHDLTGSWTVPLVILIAMTVAELLVGVPATRDWTVGEPDHRGDAVAITVRRG